MKKALKKLQAAETYNDHRLHFLKEYTYDLGVDDLVRSGASQYVVEFQEPFVFKNPPDSLGQILRSWRADFQTLSESNHSEW